LANKVVGGISIYRPIQYLGTKVRSIPMIIEAMDYLIGSNGTCLDLFSGSSVVSQALKQNGYKVIGNDALNFSYLITNAMISDHSIMNIDQLLSYFSLSNSSIEGLDKKIEIEQEAIKVRDYKTLIKQNMVTASEWENSKISTFNSLSLKTKVENTAQLLYSGTYFGFEQSKHIDQIRNKIFELSKDNKINRYEYSLLMTGLMSAISQAVFSAGKHFAQPHLIKPDKNLNFISKRIIQDRSYNIFDLFFSKVRDISEWKSGSNNNGSYGMNEKFETIVDKKPFDSLDVIYVDPPYTAQQYSRFYHIPEILSKNNFPELQMVKGKVTRGIYPDDKFKSRFCSKVQAPEAFRDTFELAKNYDASLVLSYSLSKKSITGNDRMISLENILELSKKYFGDKVSLVEFDHKYRQLNNVNSIVQDKEDKEIQIVCKR